MAAQQAINQACYQALDTLTTTSVTSDKGYYAVRQLQALQQEGIRSVISDPVDQRRVDKLEVQQQRAVRAERRSVKSKSGKELLRRRAMHIERSFVQILDCGGMRRTTLRGWENLNKRFKLAAAFYKLTQLMRKLFGFEIPKQRAAAIKGGGRGLFWRFAAMIIQLTVAVDGIASAWRCEWPKFQEIFPADAKIISGETRLHSLWSLAVRSNWCTVNICEKMVLFKREKSETKIYPNPVVRNILAGMMEIESHKMALTPVVLGFFGCMRPEEIAEPPVDPNIRPFNWDDIDLKHARITVRPGVAKTGDRRTVRIKPPAVEWLQLCKDLKCPSPW